MSADAFLKNQSKQSNKTLRQGTRRSLRKSMCKNMRTIIINSMRTRKAGCSAKHI